MDKYISPVMDVKEFAREDVITTSGGGSTCSPVDSINVNIPGCDFGDGLIFCPSDSNCGMADTR